MMNQNNKQNSKSEYEKFVHERYGEYGLVHAKAEYRSALPRRGVQKTEVVCCDVFRDRGRAMTEKACVRHAPTYQGVR